MKYYLAGSCSSEHRSIMYTAAKAIRTKLTPEDSLYCPFEMKLSDAWSMSQEKWAQKVFETDLMELDAADIVIFISFGRKSTAGANWENGYAYAAGKKIFIIQLGTASTSLMTYCSADLFLSATDVNEMKQRIAYCVSVADEKKYMKQLCETILT